MIDLHCHILPGLDDGPSGWDDSLAMARLARDDGITHLVATPHLDPPRYSAGQAEVRAGVAELQRRLDAAGIDLTVSPGGEVRLASDLVERARTGDLPTLADNGRWFFLELPPSGPTPGLEELVFELGLLELSPILCHPERMRRRDGDWTWLLRLADQGCLCQVTAMSLTGEAGGEAKRACREMARLGLIHLVASDAHSPTRRPPRLSPALPALTRLVGPEQARRLVEAHPRAVLAGEAVEPLLAEEGRRRWWRPWARR